MTLTFTAMQTQHLPQAQQMSTDVGWPHRIQDWALVLNISSGVVALQGDTVVATALATPFGSVGRASFIIVDASLRGRGLGRTITEQIMATIDPPTWHLLATPDGQALYEKLGFRISGEIVQHQGITRNIEPSGDAHWASPEDMATIKVLDKTTLGMDRSNLYDQLVHDARFAIVRADARNDPNHATDITGFAAVRDFGKGKVIGPVIAPSLDEAISLISLIVSEHTGQFLRVDTDVKTGLGPWLNQVGMNHVDGGLTMIKGEDVTPVDTAQKLFALASHALG